MLGRLAEPQSPIAAVLAALLPGAEHDSGPEGDIRTAGHIDLERFAGDWYVIASIPTLIERDACNAVERYRIAQDGSINASYSFRKGSPDGKAWTLNRTGLVHDDGSNAVWDLKFAGPIAADYRIVYVDDDYRHAIIGRNRRDYAWILSREPAMSNRDLFEHVRRLREQGYDSSRVRTVPQEWS